MTRHLITLLIGLLPLLPASATLPDSLVSRATLLAARGDIQALRPLYDSIQAELPNYARTYCNLALARAMGNNARVVSCTDSLMTLHTELFDLRGLLSLSDVKCEALRAEGDYATLASFCDDQLAWGKRRRIRKESLASLRQYRTMAQRFGDGSLRGKLLGLIDRDMAFEVRQTLQADTATTDRYTSLRCRLLMLQAFRGNDDSIAAVADTILTLYPDSLYSRATTRCLRTWAEALIKQGRWDSLSALCGRFEYFENPHGAPLEDYAELAAALKGKPATTIEFPRQPASIALPVTRDWPLLIPISLNGGGQKLFMPDTGLSCTIISEADAAEWGAEVLPTRRTIATADGLITVSPAWVERINIGPVTLRSTLVFVVSDDSGLSFPSNRVVGMDILARLGCVTLYPEKIIISGNAPAKPLDASPLRLSGEGTLRLQATCNGAPHTFSLDTACPDAAIATLAFPQTQLNDHDFCIDMANGTSISLRNFITTESKAADHDGILGADFLRHFSNVTFNFGSMSLQTGSPCAYSPQHIADLVAYKDYFALRRNAPALILTGTDTELALMRLVMLQATLAAPDSLLAAASHLETTAHHEGSEAASAVKQFVADARMEAFLCQGDYTQAAKQKRRNGMNANDFEAARAFPPPSLHAASAQTTLSTTANANGQPEVTAYGPSDKKPIPATLSLSLPLTEISARTAKTLKAKMLLKKVTTGLAIIPTLRLGDFTFSNVLCCVSEGKEERCSIGIDLLRRIHALQFLPTAITLSTTPLPTTARKEYDLLFADGPVVEQETATGYETLPLPTDAESLTIDLQRMKAGF